MDPFKNEQPTLITPAARWVAVTPSDGTDIDVPRSLYVGVGGNIAMVGSDGVEALWRNVPAGSVVPARPTRVKATGTTATDILALY